MRLRAIALPFTLLLTLCFGLTAAARADSVLYTVTGTGQGAGTQFTYLSTSGFLSFGTAAFAPTTSGDLYYVGASFGPLTSFQFVAPHYAYLSSQTTAVVFRTIDYKLDQYGQQTVLPYDTGGASFNLDIEPVGGSTAVTPEPSSLMLLGTGLVGVAGAVRRRFAHAV